MVAALGAFDSLVAVSHECDYPTEVARLPRVTASAVDGAAASSLIDSEVRRLSGSGLPVFMLDARQIEALAPTHIITQALCEVCAVSDGDVRDVVSLVDPAPCIVSLGATTLDGVWNDLTTVAAAIGREHEAAALLAVLSSRIRRVHETLKAAQAARPRVVVIEWMDPVFIAGHWTPEVVRRAGGVDVLAEAGSHSVQVSVESVRAAAPDLIVLAPCGFDVERSAREARALLATEQWSWAHGTAAWAIDGNALTSRPGPRLADAVEVFASIMAPRLFPPPPAGYAIRL